MADINLGSISYGVDVDDKGAVDGLTKLEKSVDKTVESAKKLAAEFAKSEKKLASFESAMRKGGRTISSNGIVLNKLGNVSDFATKKLAALRAAHDKLSSSASNVNKNIGKVGRSSGQAGIQLQQFIGQVQGGQSPMLALSQQSADLGFVLGAPLLGAVVGIGASLVGILAPSLLESKSATEQFEKAIESVKATLTLSAEGVANYSDQMKRLSILSKELAATQLRVTIAKQEEAFKLGSKALREYTQDVTSFVRGWSSFEDRVGDLTGKRAGADGFNEAKNALIAFKTEVTAFSLKPTEDAADDLSDAVLRLEKAGAASTEKGRELLDMTLKQVQAFREGKLTIEQLNEALKDSGVVTSEFTGKSKAMVSALEKQAATLGMSDRGVALYAAALAKATPAEIAAINAAYDKIEAHEQEAEASKDRTAALKEYEAQMLHELALESKLLAAKQARAKTVTGQVGDIAASGLDPLARLKAEREAQLALVAEYEALETSNHQMAVDARAAIDANYEARKQAALEQSFAMQSEGNKMLIDGLNSLSGTVSQVFTGMVTQTMTAREAVSGLANAVLNDAVDSLVQMGIQYTKNAIIKATADKAMLTSEQSIKAAAATAHTAAVSATVTELTTLGAMGAYAATSAIPIVGPSLAPAASSVAAGTLSALGTAAIAAAPMAGMRQYGGAVGYGSNYQVAEGGKTELYIPQSGNPMLMGSKGGQVVSNSDLMSAMGGGGGQANVDIQIINQGTPQEVTNQQQGFDEATGRQFIKLWVADFGNKGSTYRAVTTGTNAKGRTN